MAVNAGQGQTLNPGVPFKLNSASLTGASTLDFTIPYLPSGVVNALFQAVGTLTGLTSKLQASLDGGTTFNDYVASLLTAAAPLAAVDNAATTPLVPGAIYRVNVTALTGGPADIWVTIG